MHRASIGVTVMTMGLIAVVAGPRPGSRAVSTASVKADTTDVVREAWMRRVTMEPIRVVVPREARYEAVTMEPIRVVLPRANPALQDSERVVIPRAEPAPRDSGAVPRR